MMMEGLESRLLCSATAQPAAATAQLKPIAPASTVTLTRADGTNTPVSRKKDTWIIIHGLLSSKDASGIKILTDAVDKATTKDQVLVADWRQLANYADDGDQIQVNSLTAARALANEIAALHLPASRINIIGFSMGGFVAGHISEMLHSQGGVNALVGLDPSSPKIHVDGQRVRAPLDLGKDSAYSIVFHGVDNGSPIQRALTADDTIRIDNIGTLATVRHAGVFDVFTNMTKINNTANPDAVSSLFTLGNIIRHEMPPWKKDAYNPVEGLGGYEAVIRAKGSPGSLRPDQLTYLNKKKHVRHIDGG